MAFRESRNHSQYGAARRAHWNATAHKSTRLAAAYHRRLAELYRAAIPKGSSVLEVGCGTGDLLASLGASLAVGIDFSTGMLREARAQHPECLFVCADAHETVLSGTFDYVVLSDLINDVYDVQMVLESLVPYCHVRTRIVLNTYSKLWEVPLRVASALHLTRPRLQQNWLTLSDLRNMFRLAGIEIVRSSSEVLSPIWFPGISWVLNRWLAKLPMFEMFNLAHMIVAKATSAPAPQAPSVSVVVAARNEAGNMEELFKRVPQMGAFTELVIVEGGSSDNTLTEAQRCAAAHPELRPVVLKQRGKGKGDAVRLGFEQASGDILMILDADLTVAPEELPRFHAALAGGICEFANGVRMVYPMEQRAMRFANLVGNKFFSIVFSWLLGQPVRDTLCGTKVLWRTDYQRVAANRAYFGDFDPFGDFDLLFGAAKLSLKIMDIPIRYRDRTYGTTNIQRWRHGVILLTMVVFGGRKLKWV